MTIEQLEQLPKVELHCHLDGSLSRAFMESHLQREVSQAELSVSDDCESLVEYLEKFELPCSCIQDEKGLFDAGYDVLRTMHEENVCYAEIRFAPLLSVGKGMDTRAVLEALLAGLECGRKAFGVDYNVITCAMRHHSEEDNFKMIKTAREFLGAGVCAADLAGAESLYPMSAFMDLFQKTKALGMPFTIHAGECGSTVNIADAIEAGAKRIGHGIAMRLDKDVRKMVRAAGTGVEMCPISNLQTKAVQSTADYPIGLFLDEGLLVSVNTDNRTVSNTSLTREFDFIQKTYGVTDAQVLRIIQNAADTAFADDDMKQKLYKKLVKA